MTDTSTPPIGRTWQGRLHAVAVTYRRPDEIRTTVSALMTQTRPPDTLTIVDNDPDRSVEAWTALLPDSRYLALSENLGPAGGVAAGVAAVLGFAAPEDRILIVDDDDPPRTRTAIADLMTAFEGDELGRPAAVGLVGARFDARRGRLVRLADEELTGLVDVDYLGGGQLPIYRVDALRQIGGCDSDLFFGFEELELGLRLRQAGHRLVVDGRLLRESRIAVSRYGLGRRIPSTPLPPWRRYYSSRNIVLISRRFGACSAVPSAAIRSGLGAAIRALAYRNPRSAYMALLGAFHGLIGRSGRVVEPGGR